MRELIEAPLFEFIAQLQCAHVPRIFIEVEIGVVARVLVFGARAQWASIR
jgi:hypothetical protein